MKKGVIISQEEGRSRRFWARQGGEGEGREERERSLGVCFSGVRRSFCAGDLAGRLPPPPPSLLTRPFLPGRSLTRRISTPPFYLTRRVRYFHPRPLKRRRLLRGMGRGGD